MWYVTTRATKTHGTVRSSTNNTQEACSMNKNIDTK